MSSKDGSNQQFGAVPSSPASRNSPEEDDLESLFECPVCSDSVVPPIIQCAHGHLVCSECIKMVAGKCPTCREPIGNIRNLALEKLANKIVFSCKFKPSGCYYRLPVDAKIVHQQSCMFRPVHCPFEIEECTWQGSVDQIKPHLLGSHQQVTVLEGNEVMLTAKCNSETSTDQWTWIQECFGHTFVIILRMTTMDEDAHYFCSVMQCFGSNGAASDFAYHLDYHGSGGVDSFEGIPIDMHDSMEIAMENSDCLEFEISADVLQCQGGIVSIKSTITHLL